MRTELPSGKPLNDLLGLPEYFHPVNVLAHTDNRVVLTARVAQPAPLQASECVVKLLIPPHTEAEAERFVSEYLRLDALRHPNWVRPLLFGRLREGGCYLALEQESGEVLSRIIPQTWGPATLGICHGVLSGIAALHFTKHAHLDLHPDQILVRSNGSDTERQEQIDAYGVSLLDLGLSAPFRTRITPRGTPGYIAPEFLLQASASRWDGRADLYSFGAILHKLVTGQPAFPGRDTKEILQNQVQGFDVTEIIHDEHLPKGLRLLIIDLLQSDPEARPTDSTEVWQRLRDLLPPSDATQVANEPIGADVPPFLGRSQECETFLNWISISGDELLHCSIVGEPGIGRSRLMDRLRAIAFAQAWTGVDQSDVSCTLAMDGKTLHITEHSSCILDDEQTPSSDADPGTNQLRLVLQPFDKDTLCLMAESLGVQSTSLIDQAASLTLGNPSLLVGLVHQLREGPALSGDLFQGRFGQGPLCETPPRSWIHWVRHLLGELSFEERTQLISQSILPSAAPLDLVQSALVPSHLSAHLGGRLARRGLLLNGGKSLCSDTWARALQLADPTTASPLLDSFEAWLANSTVPLQADVAEELARTSLRICRPSASFLLAAWHSYLREGQIERATVLAIDFLAAELSLGLDLLTVDTRALLLRKSMVSGNMVCRHVARRIPIESVSEIPPFQCDVDIWVLFRAWVLYAWSLQEEAAAIVHAQSRPSDEELRFVWCLLRVATMQALQDSPSNLQRLLQELRDDPFQDQNLEANLRIRAASPTLGSHNAKLQIERVALHLDKLSPNNQASYWMNEGLEKYHNGRYGDASASIERALRIYDEFQLDTLGQIARQNLSAILFSAGDLPGAAESARRVYAGALRRGAWRQCADTLYNILSIAVLRGHLGAARHASQQLKRIAPIVGRRESEQDSRCGDALVALKLGLLSQADSLLSNGWTTDDYLYPKALALRGEACIYSGEEDLGRSLLRQGIVATQGYGLLDDAAELLVGWLFCELDVGRRELALALFEEFAVHEAHCSVPTRALVMLAEAEMAGLEWLDSAGIPGGAVALLENSRDELKRCDLGYYTWRTYWRQGQIHARSGNRMLAARHLYGARDALLGLSRSIASRRLSESLLGLPSPSRLIHDLEQMES